jgi:hypothetical protein
VGGEGGLGTGTRIEGREGGEKGTETIKKGGRRRILRDRDNERG